MSLETLKRQFYYRPAWNASAHIYEKAVCQSVKRVDCDKTEEGSVHIFIPYERSFSLVLREEERLVGATSST